MADLESLITLSASILLANQVHSPDVDAQRARIKNAVNTAQQIHAEVERALAAAAQQH